MQTSYGSRNSELILILHYPFLMSIGIIVFILIYDMNLTSPRSHHNLFYDTAFAHMPTSNTSRIQEWTDSSNGIDIKFVYEPRWPVIDTFTELKFSIENATTGDHIPDPNNATARVVVTNGQRLFKFENISVGNSGHFSVKYLFPDDGTHQVITRLDTSYSSTVSSFNVFVPHQAPPSILDPIPSPPGAGSENYLKITMPLLLIGIIGGIPAVIIFLIKRKK